MLERLRRRLTYANVMATLAMFAVLGGGAYAAATIGAGDIKRNAVRTKHIKKNAVKTPKIADGAVSTPKLALGARGVAQAGAFVNGDGTLASFFNRAGGAPSVEHPFDGIYRITFPGITVGTTSVPIATLRAGTDLIEAFSSAPAVQVRTRSSAGTNTNASFQITVFAASAPE